MAALDLPLRKQHLIDPEICIRCNTCEETCPVNAVSHDGNNYVVDAEICNFCMDCISPCPTGSIDNWRVVASAYSLATQFSWTDLPEQEKLADQASKATIEALEDEVDALIATAHSGGKAQAPISASKPGINLFNRINPALATVTGNFRLTSADSESDVRHLILDFGDLAFPVLEGQSIGIVPPGLDGSGQPHKLRLYSISSPRDGERPNRNNLSLTVKRDGLCSNYLCDLAKGDRLTVTGPFGATFLMPDDANANLIMICTGTGSAPFRGFTERRRRAMPQAAGRMMLFFGARRPEELPYFGPLQKVPDSLLAKHFAYSRVPGAPKTYVQDKLRQATPTLARLLPDANTCIYICGLRGMEAGVDEALADICRQQSLDWTQLRQTMLASGRYHVETY